LYNCNQAHDVQSAKYLVVLLTWCMYLTTGAGRIELLLLKKGCMYV